MGKPKPKEYCIVCDEEFEEDDQRFAEGDDGVSNGYRCICCVSTCQFCGKCVTSPDGWCWHCQSI